MGKLIKKFIKTFFITITLLFLIVGIVVMIKVLPIVNDYRLEAKKIVEDGSYNDFILSETSYIYDDNGKVLAKLKSDTDSNYLNYNQIPINVINAFIAVEDRSFWTNDGYDIKGIIRVGLNYIKTKGEQAHGASTITQQLARNIYITKEVTISRKIKEIFLAHYLTKKYTKEDIIEFYCNDIYFSNGYYGISAAARGYFNKDIDELSLSEIAYICSIPNSPSYYDPYENPENALKRRDKILSDMLEENYITQLEYEKAIKEEIIINKPSYEVYNYQTTYAIDCAIEYLMTLNNFEFKYHFDTKLEYEQYNDYYNKEYINAKQQLYTGGYKIYTSINENAQELLQQAIDENLAYDTNKSENGYYELQAASTVIDNKTGKVIAISGGRSQDSDVLYGLNRAYQSYRQPGSTIKPLIVYTPALQSGYSASSQIMNISITEAKKKDIKISELIGETMSLRLAVEKSINGCAYKLFNDIGINYGLSFIEQMKFKNIVNNDYTLSASLGGLTYGTTTVEMASAYATLVNDGIYKKPTCITSIIDGEDEIYKEEDKIQVYDKNAANKMIEIMQGVIKTGTAKNIKWTNQMPVAGKTGTTNDNKDAWFCGVSPYYSVSVWIGNDTPKELKNMYGGTYPAQIWKQIMEQLISDKEIIEFPKPENTISTGNETYLPGRSDDELLSDGYTVGDYRADYAIVDEVKTLSDKINLLESEDINIEILYNEANQKIETIYGTNATNKAREYLDTIYNSKKIYNNLN